MTIRGMELYAPKYPAIRRKRAKIHNPNAVSIGARSLRE